MLLDAAALMGSWFYIFVVAANDSALLTPNATISLVVAYNMGIALFEKFLDSSSYCGSILCNNSRTLFLFNIKDNISLTIKWVTFSVSCYCFLFFWSFFRAIIVDTGICCRGEFNDILLGPILAEFTPYFSHFNTLLQRIMTFCGTVWYKCCLLWPRQIIYRKVGGYVNGIVQLPSEDWIAG